MTTRRRFLGSMAAGTLALGALPDGTLLAAAGAAGTDRKPRRPPARPLRILILGGTSFLGPHLVRYAVERGHRVTTFTRGRRQPGLFEQSFAGVEPLIGDRDQPDGLAALQGKSWDAVIDTSGRNQRWTRESATLLRGSAGRYLYVSSTGVYFPYRTTRIAEDGPIALTETPPNDPPSYGVMKALSEIETREAFGADALVVRPGYIVGPGDPTDRWTHWPVRIARGGEIAVTGRKSDPVQYIDVRDLTEWMIHLLEDGTTGTFNAVGPGRQQTLEELVYGIAATTAVDLSWTWIEDYEWLKAYPFRTLDSGEVRGFTASIPWIMVEGDHAGQMQIDNRRARAAGLAYRPLATTARDTLQWRLTEAVPEPIRSQPRYAMSEDDERRMLAAWRAR